MAGEVTQDSGILQARLTRTGQVRNGYVRGAPGVAAFVLATDPTFADARLIGWLVASEANNHLVKTKVGGLEPGTQYYYRLLSRLATQSLEAGPVGSFRTLDAVGVSRPPSFVAVTGMNRFAFRATTWGIDRALGFPGLEAITERQPDFFISTGDSVYYDTPYFTRAKTLGKMRAKWHVQFATPRFRGLFLSAPTYWLKDDHDFRYDDGDPYGPLEPSPELGIRVFREQVPVIDPQETSAVTYRTHRVSDLLQIWLLEGRDYRDRNTMEPGPGKSILGQSQREWLDSTLLASDAVFKIIISPTAMVGPDDTTTGRQGKILSSLFGGVPVGQEGDRRNAERLA